MFESSFLYAIAGTVGVSLISFSGLLVFGMGERSLRRAVFILVSISVGGLFGDSFIHLLPEAFETGSTIQAVSLAVFAGILVFFVLEKFLSWRHSHSDGEADSLHPEENTRHKLSTLVLVGDGIHNLIDGIIIGVGFAVSVEVGFATLVAIALHEIPQEIGDFGLLLYSGMSKSRALLYNFFSALAAILGVVIVSFAAATVENILPLALAFAAGGFIYIAGSDLVPELHKTKGARKSFTQIICIALGFFAMLWLSFIE